MLPNLTNQYISYSMALFSANEIRTFFFQDFRGFDATGHQDSIHKLTLARMDSGDASLTVHNSLSGEKLIEGDFLKPFLS